MRSSINKFGRMDGWVAISTEKKQTIIIFHLRLIGKKLVLGFIAAPVTKLGRWLRRRHHFIYF